jgi:hypothetical protein
MGERRTQPNLNTALGFRVACLRCTHQPCIGHALVLISKLFCAIEVVPFQGLLKVYPYTCFVLLKGQKGGKVHLKPPALVLLISTSYLRLPRQYIAIGMPECS